MGRTSRINKNRFVGRNLALQFPSDIGPMGMVLTFTPYTYETTVDQRNAFKVNVPAPVLSASILLPLPAEIKDDISMGISAHELGSVGGLIGDIAKDGVMGTVRGVGETLNQTRDSFMGKIADGDVQKGLSLSAQAIKYISRSALDSVTPGLGAAVDITGGTTVNPHKALSFNGVDIKNFNFNWSFFPESVDESNAIKNISDTIKKHSLPEYSQPGANDTSFSRAFLKYPDLVIIELIGLDEEFYVKYKPCMVKGIGLNYSSQGNAVLKGGKPAAISMSISVSEVRPHNREDYQ